jgi:hypothetical protein
VKRAMFERSRTFCVPLYSTDELVRLARIDDEPAGACAAERDAFAARRQLTDSQNHALAQVYVDRVRRARMTPPIERLAESLRSFESVAERMHAGIRIREPDANDAECLRRVRLQLATLRRLHDRPVYMLIAGDGR